MQVNCILSIASKYVVKPLPSIVTLLNTIPSLTLDLDIVGSFPCLGDFHGTNCRPIINKHVGLERYEEPMVVQEAISTMDE